ncbi:MAG: hypothetical protein NC395_09085 [Prevotella sp.]|nr:hypothetical protein [Prevotella sp.]
MKRYNIFKKISALVTAACLCVPAAGISVLAEAPALKENGEGIIEISTAEEFSAFAESCVLDSNSEGKSYLLTADINLNGCVTVPSFGGIFDGGNHTVGGLRIDVSGSEQGLFRYIEREGVVKNLIVSGSVAPNGSAEKCGGIAGVNRGRIINCAFSGAVKGSSDCGGIAGVNEKSGLIANCVSSGAVQARNFTGGTVGENFGTVLHCTNNMSVNTNAYDEPIDPENLNIDEIYSAEQVADITDAGGIAGYSGGSVQGCVNYGSVGYPHVGYNIGGIAGRQDGYVSCCENYGTVNGRKDIAGIVGQAEPHFSLLFSERTLSKLRTRLEELNAAIDVAVTDAETRSDIMSADREDILDKLDEIRAGTDGFLDETDRIVNGDIASVNELSSRVSDLVDMVAPAADSFTEASDTLTEALGELGEAVRLLEEAGDTAGEGMDVLFPILGKLSEITDNITEAGNSADKSLEALQKGLGDEATMKAALNNLSYDFQSLSAALNNLSVSASSAVNALNGFKTSPEYAAAKSSILNQLDRLSSASANLSEGLKNSVTSFRAIADLMSSGIYDPSEYSFYIQDILNNFSDGSVSGIFESLSETVSSVSDLIGSQAAAELRDTLGAVSGNVPGEFDNLGSAGQNISGNVGTISDNTDITSLYDFIRYIREANGELSSSADPLNGMIEAVRESSEYFDEAGASLVAAAAAASEAADKASAASDSVSDGFDRITETLDYFAGMDKITFTGADDSFIASRDRLSGLAGDLTDILSELNENADGTVSVLAEDLRGINGKASEVRDTLMDLADEMSSASADISDYTEDISSKDAAGRSDGKIAECRNCGRINGDVNVGGIAGAMAIEYGFDPEGDIETIGDRSPNFMYQTKTVVRDCVNRGEVISKKNCAGGIAGYMKTGCLINCAGLGNVSSSDGSYAGGVAGQSEAAISGCSAKCRVNGLSFVGGIAGEGNDIVNCRSFAVIESGDERVGAIAGKSTGDFEGNAFIDSGTGGVDGISYSGKAYPVDYNYMLRLDNVPDEFNTLTLTFKTEDGIVGEIECGYGESVPESRLPAIPEKEGFFAEWEDADLTNVTFGAEINAVYKPFVTSLSSIELRRNGLPIIIAEGNFTDSDKLNALSDAGAGYVDSDMWTVTLPDDGSPVHTVRYLPEVPLKKAVVTVTENGETRTAKTDIDGSYLVFEVNGLGFGLTVSEKPFPVRAAAASGIAAAVTAAAAALAVKNVKKKRKK